MKGVYLLLLALVLSLNCIAQKTEFTVTAGTGFFFFSGKSPVSHQRAFSAGMLQNPYTVPYGRKPGYSFTAGGTAKYISKSTWLLGGSVEFQSLSSRSTVDTLFRYDMLANTDTVVLDGSSSLRVKSIAISPFVGKRVLAGRVSLDITAGLDIAFLLRAEEKLDLKPYSQNSNEKEIQTRKTDIRLRLMAEMNIKKICVFAGYCKGLSNYYTQYVGSQPEAYSNFIRIGVGYRLN